MFVSPDGRTGMVVQKEGNLAGFIWDFFVSPYERARTPYDFVLLAMSQGGRALATRDHPLMTTFFERFGFQAVAVTRHQPRDYVHMMLLDQVFKPREASFRQVLETLDSRQGLLVNDGEEVVCSYCRRGVQAQVLPAELFGGYHCQLCNFTSVHGTLTSPRGKDAQP
jgi:hypothetical protein